MTKTVTVHRAFSLEIMMKVIARKMMKMAFMSMIMMPALQTCNRPHRTTHRDVQANENENMIVWKAQAPRNVIRTSPAPSPRKLLTLADHERPTMMTWPRNWYWMQLQFIAAFCARRMPFPILALRRRWSNRLGHLHLTRLDWVL